MTLEEAKARMEEIASGRTAMAKEFMKDAGYPEFSKPLKKSEKAKKPAQESMTLDEVRARMEEIAPGRAALAEEFMETSRKMREREFAAAKKRREAHEAKEKVHAETRQRLQEVEEELAAWKASESLSDETYFPFF